LTVDGMTAGELKQRILAIYNATNQQVWGAGVREQRVELLRDRILVIAVHQRARVLASLDPTRRDLTRQVDVALMDLYKSVLQAELESSLGLRVAAILKDYDPKTQLSCTLIVLNQSLGSSLSA
jgi:hypothetical protein